MKLILQTAVVTALAAGFLFSLTPEVAAQIRGPYLALDGGVSILPDSDLKIGGLPGRASFDSGYRFDACLGYRLNRWAAFELEGGYFENTINGLTIDQTGADLEKSSMSGVPILGNFMFRFENQSDFVPFIAIGAGGEQSTLRILDESDNEIVFAVQVKAGLIYKIEERAWLEVIYKALGTAEQSYVIGGTRVKTDQMLTHFIGAGVVWKF